MTCIKRYTQKYIRECQETSGDVSLNLYVLP